MTRAALFAATSRLPVLPEGWIAISLDPAIRRSGIASYRGGRRSGSGTIRAEAFPSSAIKNRIRLLLAGKGVKGVFFVVEGTRRDHIGNGVKGLVRSAIAVLPPGSRVLYVPPVDWQVIIPHGDKDAKSRALEFAIAAPEIHWKPSRAKRWAVRQDDDASDAACLLFYALTIGIDLWGELDG